MAQRVRPKQCQVAGCTLPGRIVPSRGMVLCLVDHPDQVPTPDPARTVDGLERRGRLEAVTRTALGALNAGVPMEDVSEALARARRRWELSQA